MFKKFLIAALLLLPAGAFAQEHSKMAYVNSDEIIMAMPETAAMKTTLEKLQQQFEKELKSMEDEMAKKYTALQQQSDTLAESIKVRRLKDVTDIRERAETYQRESQEELYKKQQELYVPIQQKVMEAIKAVAEENGYSYVADKGVYLYISPNAINATPLIKKKLGLQ